MGDVPSYAGQTFSRVFTQPAEADPREWRIRGSGVSGQPDAADTTYAVMKACESLGIDLSGRSMGSPAGADSYHLEAEFLDGGLRGQTGNYFYYPKGVWVHGPKAVLLLLLQLQVKVRPSWLRRHGLESTTLESLRAELKKS